MWASCVLLPLIWLKISTWVWRPTGKYLRQNGGGGGAGLGNVESALMSEKEIYTRMGEKLTEKQRKRATDPETRGGS